MPGQQLSDHESARAPEDALSEVRMDLRADSAFQKKLFQTAISDNQGLTLGAMAMGHDLYGSDLRAKEAFVNGFVVRGEVDKRRYQDVFDPLSMQFLGDLGVKNTDVEAVADQINPSPHKWFRVGEDSMKAY